MIKNMAKLDVTPAVRLSSGSPWKSMSLAKMPNAAPAPPTQGPYRTAKMAGITAAGQNATPIKVMPKSVNRPTTAYTAAHMPITATSEVFVLYLLPKFLQILCLFKAGFNK